MPFELLSDYMERDIARFREDGSRESEIARENTYCRKRRANSSIDMDYPRGRSRKIYTETHIYIYQRLLARARTPAPGFSDSFKQFGKI